MSMSNEDEHDECALCLLPLESYDQSHPLQCPSPHCHFNCCMDCIEGMIKSAKDETEASDGNTFRVFLHCPNCRNAHMGVSVRDTLLLRKVDQYLHHGIQVTDERLTASELRFRYTLEKDADVALAIDAARHRQDDFFGWGVEISMDAVLNSNNVDNALGQSLGTQTVSWSFDDEEGFEVYEDTAGRHKSFIFRHHSMEGHDEMVKEPDLADIRRDSTLLCGLDGYMTDQEQQFMTAQLISGNPSRLAVATEMMHYVSALSRQGITPNLKRQRSSSLDVALDPKRSMLDSIREIIREGAEARRLEEEKDCGHADVAKFTRTVQFGAPVTGGRGILLLKKQVEMETKRQMEYMKLHPLPLRMPKYAEVTATKAGSSRVTFLDDMWDGSILDAYSKVMVNKSFPLGHFTVTKQYTENPGVRRVIDAGTPASPRSARLGIVAATQPRVIIASIHRDFGRQGIVKGDVVSHFNGEPFAGTARELGELIASRHEGEMLTFVFNADRAVAEALKRRSLVSPW